MALGPARRALAQDPLAALGESREVGALRARLAQQHLDAVDREALDAELPLSRHEARRERVVGRGVLGRQDGRVGRELVAELSRPGARHQEPGVVAESDRVHIGAAAGGLEQARERAQRGFAAILAPLVRGRKGEFRKELEKMQRSGFTRARIDGEMRSLDEDIRLDKRRNHTIEIVVDRLLIKPGISARLDDKRLITTPKSVSKGFMTPDMMVVVDYDGNKVAGDRDASTELPMHLEVYRNRPDVNAVVHAHPPLATGFAVAGIPLDRAVLAEVVTTLGSIPIAEYGTPSTRELADAVAPYVKAHDGLLLANHGALALGRDLFSAYYKMETIEHFARISLVARLLGRERLLSREEVERLQALRVTYGIAAPAPICPDPLPQDGAEQACQIVVAPSAPGERLVAETARPASAHEPGEIRLTYAQLTALIAETVRELVGGS